MLNRSACGYVVTVAVNNFVFVKPEFVGGLVSLFAKLIKTGNTSYAERQRGIEECHCVAWAKLTYVAIDEERKPQQIN